MSLHVILNSLFSVPLVQPINELPSLFSMPKSKGRRQQPPSTSTSTSSSTTTPPPNWPPLTPSIPAEHLYVETLLSDQILIIRNLFSAKLCKDYTSFLSTLPLTTTPGIPKRGDAVRVNDRFQVQDAHFAQQLWEQTALKQLVQSYSDDTTDVWRGKVLGLNPNIRIYRYKPGQFFDQHYDESNKVDFGPDKLAARTTWTLLVYLTAAEGGETAFYPEPVRKGPTPEPIVVGTEAGMALLHRHHEECMLHEGREVVSGEKWVLRSDLIVSR
jgi:hypothetical protein